MKTLILLSLLSFSTMAQEEAVKVSGEPACTDSSIETKNLPKNNDLNFEESWCLFWSANDLLSFYEETPLSGYDLALQFFNTDAVRNNIELPEMITDMGANIANVLIVGQSSKGICRESQTNFTNGDWAKLSMMMKKIMDSKKTLIKVMCENKFQNTAPFKEIPPKILKILNKLSKDKKAAALLDVSCGERHKFKNKYGVGHRTINKFPDAKVIEKLDEILDNKGPASVSYDLNFIHKNANYKRDMSEGFIGHTSTIIGRRFNTKTNKCEYQIKDSVGNRCPKKSIYECDKKTGLTWVPRENLQKNIYDVSWLVKR